MDKTQLYAYLTTMALCGCAPTGNGNPTGNDNPAGPAFGKGVRNNPTLRALTAALNEQHFEAPESPSDWAMTLPGKVVFYKPSTQQFQPEPVEGPWWNDMATGDSRTFHVTLRWLTWPTDGSTFGFLQREKDCTFTRQETNPPVPNAEQEQTHKQALSYNDGQEHVDPEGQEYLDTEGQDSFNPDVTFSIECESNNENLADYFTNSIKGGLLNEHIVRNPEHYFGTAEQLVQKWAGPLGPEPKVTQAIDTNHCTVSYIPGWTARILEHKGTVVGYSIPMERSCVSHATFHTKLGTPIKSAKGRFLLTPALIMVGNLAENEEPWFGPWVPQKGTRKSSNDYDKRT